MRLNSVLIFSFLMAAASMTACSSNSGSSSAADTDSGSQTGIIYVNATSTAASPDGISWNSAYATLSDAIAHAAAGAEVWVAKGTYYPTSSTTDRTATFLLEADVSIYGGFSGSETSRDQRSYALNETILSGDIDKDGILDSGNSYHVVRGADDAVIDGFTITMGYAAISGSTPVDFSTYYGGLIVASGSETAEILRVFNGVHYIAGGGMLNLQAAPKISNCIFEYNYASKGGAVYNMVQRNYPPTATTDYDAATFENCIFRYNTGVGRGGAVNNDYITDPTFISCQFLSNTCTDKGGAVYSDFCCDATFVNVLFADNTAERGTALVSDGSSNPSLLYVTIVNNTATDIGAALYQGSYSADSQVAGKVSQSNDPKLMKCLVMGNTSGASGSSIANWLDCALNTDSSSVVETTDGSYTASSYFTDQTNKNYEPKGAYTSLGWSASRDTSNWATEITALSSRTFATFPYTTASTAGSSVKTYYVDAAKNGSGTSWSDAYASLTSALAAAKKNDIIYVATGTYYPATGTNRETSFVIPEGVKLYGGYSTGGATRDTAAYPAILSGDIDKDGILDSGNSYHVVIGSSGSVIDGFTIKHGYADGEWFHQRGAGILVYGSSSASNIPTINNCIIQYNYAVEGAGIANYNYGSPVITACTFQNNSAQRGGAMLCRTVSDPAVSGTTFSSNTSTDRGGAVYIDYGAWPAFSGSCVFTGNSSAGYGGAVYVDDNAAQRPCTKPSFISSSFNGNSTGAAYGGAFFGYNSSCYITLTSCSFGTNTSGTAGSDLAFRFKANVTLSGCTYDSLYKDSTVTGL